MFKNITFITFLVLLFCANIFAQEKISVVNDQINTYNHQNALEEKTSNSTNTKFGNTFKVESDLDQEAVSQKPISSAPVSTFLVSLNKSERNNAILNLEISSAASKEALKELKKIEDWWNNGKDDLAIKNLDLFEKQYNQNHVAIGIQWKNPTSSSFLNKGVDVQVGTRDNIYNVEIDYHSTSSNIFAVLQYSDSNSRYWWSVNISTDGGQTWTESYTWGNVTYEINDVTAAVSGDFLYVGYINDTTQDGARIRRFFTNDGTSDSSFGSGGWLEIYDNNVEIKEIALAIINNGSQLYHLSITNDGVLHYYWSNDASTWNAVTTGITDADHGLDAHNNLSSPNAWIVVSYVNTNGQLYSAFRSSSGWDIHSLALATTSSLDVTSIAAWQDTVIIAYEDTAFVRYRITYNGGTSWTWGTIASGTNYFRPHVSGKNNGGFRVIYQDEAGAFDPLWTRHRTYAFITGWSNPEQVNEVDVFTGRKTNIDYIPPVSEPFAHGALFITNGALAYFDRIEGFPNSIDDINNNIALSFDLIQNFPNPFNPSTTIKYYLSDLNSQKTTLQIYNSAGQLVRTLVNAEQSKGEYSVEWDGLDDFGKSVSSGLYFYKLKHGNKLATRKLLKLK